MAIPGRKDLRLGDRIKCKNWKDLKRTAFALASEGYGVTVIGFGDMSDDILTITALPEKPKDEQLLGLTRGTKCGTN